MREAVKHLVLPDALPSSPSPIDEIDSFERYLACVFTPLTVEQVEGLMSLLPADEDDGSGLAWSLLHLIETSPVAALSAKPDDHAGNRIRLLYQRTLTA